MVTQGGRDKDFSLLKLSPDVNSRTAAGKSRYPGGLSEDYVTEQFGPSVRQPFRIPQHFSDRDIPDIPKILYFRVRWIWPIKEKNSYAFLLFSYVIILKYGIPKDYCLKPIGFNVSSIIVDVHFFFNKSYDVILKSNILLHVFILFIYFLCVLFSLFCFGFLCVCVFSKKNCLGLFLQNI